MNLAFACCSLLLLAAPDDAQTQRSLLAELDTLDQDLRTAERRVVQIEAEHLAAIQVAAQAQTDLAAARLAYKRNFERLRKRLRALARAPAEAGLAAVGSAATLKEYLDGKRLLRWVARHDRRLQDDLAVERSRLATIEARLTQHQTELARLASDARLHRAEIAGRRRARLELLQSVVQRRELAEQAGRERVEARQGLGRLLQRLRPEGAPSAHFAENRGRLPWPAVGRVKVAFGKHAELTHGTITEHPGIDVEAGAGTPVHAVAPGTVAFADWLRGYGQLVILEHEGSYHTLAAHLGTVEVKVGDTVGQGQTIGTVGDTGSLRGTVLYFELRHQGRPLDPLDWLRRG